MPKIVDVGHSVGRTKYRDYVYFWFSDAADVRVGPFFPSRRKALRWKDSICKCYTQYPLLDDYLAQCDKGQWLNKRRQWNAARDNFHDLLLFYGAVEYRGENFFEYIKKKKSLDALSLKGNEDD